MGRCRAGLIAVPAIVAAVIAAMIVAGQPVLATSAAPGKRVVLRHDHRSGAGRSHAGTTAASDVSAANARPLRVVGRALPSGIAGLPYLAVLRASGGKAPYAWSAAELPAGLRLSPGGVITGYPLATGTRTVTVRARDLRGAVSVARLRLAVPTSLPGRCAARSCALLVAGPRTVAVAASAIVAVARSAGTGQVTRVELRGGPAVRTGDLLAIAATPAIPSGLIAVAKSVLTVGLVTPRGRLTVLAVSTATPADAFPSGTVQVLGAAAPVTSRWLTWPRIKQAPVARTKKTAGTLSCAGGVTARAHGLGVSPSLTPSVTLAWQRRPAGVLAGRPGEPPARDAGLRLFQFTLSGTIALNLGVSVSGAARCLMTLPALIRTVTAGGLGTVVLRLRPVLRLVTTAELDVATSVTLTCAALYRLDAGTVTRAGYCTAARRPLAFSSLGGASATVTGAIAVGVSLDDQTLVTGTLGAALRAAYQPGSAPAAGVTVAQTDARTGARLTAPLGLLWAGAPAATVAQGRFFAARLGTWSRPASATGPRNLAVTPAIAYPWNAAVCGYDTPTFGRDELAVAGGGFLPGELAGIATGWGGPLRRASASPDGSFTLRIGVGEVPSVLDRIFPIAAAGMAGSSAQSSISLDADGCVLQTGRPAGLTVRWGGNGFDPGSVVSLAIDGAVAGTARADRLGSGGAVVRLPCPAAGGYTWQVSGLVGGRLVAATSRVRCAGSPVAGHQASPRYPVPGAPVRSGAAAASLAGQLPWRPPPGPGLAVA